MVPVHLRRFVCDRFGQNGTGIYLHAKLNTRMAMERLLRTINVKILVDSVRDTAVFDNLTWAGDL